MLLYLKFLLWLFSSNCRLSGVNTEASQSLEWSLQGMELLQHTSRLQFRFTPVNEKCVTRFPSFSGASVMWRKNHCSMIDFSNTRPLDLSQTKAIRQPLLVLFQSGFVLGAYI